MTEREPPRLRTRGDLDPELALALASSQDEEPSAEELALLARAIRHDVEPVSERRPLAGAFWRRRGLALRSSVVVATFAVGAGAGVAVAGVSYVAFRSSETQAPAPSAVTGVRTVPPAAHLRSRHRPEPAAEPGVQLPPAIAPEAPPKRVVRSERAPPIEAERVNDDVPGPQAAREDELSLLARAQASLSIDASQALALAAEHQERFARGALTQEREVIAVDALLRLGRTTEARLRAERFHRQFPTSAHRRRVEVLFDVRQERAVNHK